MTKHFFRRLDASTRVVALPLSLVLLLITSTGRASKSSGLCKIKWIAASSALLLTVFVFPTPRTSAASGEYTFQKIANVATSCTPAPGGGYFQFDFEPWSINNRGEIASAADFTSTNVNPCGPGNGSEGEGAFLYSGGTYPRSPDSVFQRQTDGQTSCPLNM